MNKILFSKRSIYIIIFFSTCLSLLLSKHYLLKYDQFKIINKGLNQKIEHSMIKAAINNHWYEADKIIKDVKDGKNFLVSGGEYDEFLPQRLLALYYLIIKDNILDKEKKLKIKNNKFGFLFINTIFFYLSLLYFTKILIKKFPIKNVFIIILFVSLEPTIFQYHSSFYNESYAFPFQIFLISLAIQNKKKLFHNFLIGVTIGVLYCLGTEFLLYFLPASLYLIIVFKKRFLKPLFSLLCGYALIMSIISVHNFYRTNNAYFTTEASKSAIYVYLVPNIISYKNNISVLEANNLLLQDMLKWSKKNNIKLINPNTRSVFDIVENKQDEIKFLNYIQETTMKVILENPYYVLKFTLKKTVHALTLNPFYIKNFYSHDSKGNNKYYGSETQKKNIPYRIVYSLIFYLVILRGLKNLIKLKEINVITIIILLSMYQVAVLGWMGTSRYLMPILIYLSIFFSFGIFPNKINN